MLPREVTFLLNISVHQANHSEPLTDVDLHRSHKNKSGSEEAAW